MYRSIVVGTDGSPTARVAVNRAAQLAKLCGAELHVVCAYRDADPMLGSAVAGVATRGTSVDARGDVEAMLRELGTDISREGVAVETYAVPGNAAQAILELAEAEGCDLIVLGNRGMQGARRFLGSVPSNVAHHASCSVLITSTS